ncbi:TPA: phosphoadenosine phosphosulfate reductase family protein, partial [Clostridioides difficile]|nr:phosphoadenosine phosphosulfate reductase family protein [Clostridioides difficile]HEK8884515.1 phosphoadenosine phosphosulfate reductase family protein [Clostridioides difficile]
MKYVASFSGGKDSAAMLLLILEKRLLLDEIVFIDTGLEFKEIYDIIDDFEKRINFKITR